jgi:hypothetical protein
MVKNELVKAMRLNIESIILEIKTFIENHKSIIALISFTLVNLLVDYTNYLNLFLETRSIIKPNVFL